MPTESPADLFETTAGTATTDRLHLLLSTDPDGTVSAVVLNLPGTGSCGDTEADAVENAVESATAAIEQYEADGDPIPWRDSTRDPVPAGAKAKWVILNG